MDAIPDNLKRRKQAIAQQDCSINGCRNSFSRTPGPCGWLNTGAQKSCELGNPEIFLAVAGSCSDAFPLLR
jgi:hypothetical protein